MKKEDKIDIIEGGFLVVLFIVVLTVIIHLIFFIEKKEDIQLHQFKRRIYSLKEDNRVTGFYFFISKGRINYTDYYFFYLKNTKLGGFVQEKIPVDETLLIEKDTIPTVIRQYIVRTEIRKSNWLPFFHKTDIDTLDVYNHSRKKDNFFSERSEYNYILIIPKRTITEKQVYLEKNSNLIPYDFNNMDRKNENNKN